MIIPLNARFHSDLNWSEARLKAHESNGPILWKMEFGLFDQLQYPLSNEMQCRAFGLALEHFCDTLWKEFHDRTKGICLYQGPLDFSLYFPWDKEQFSDDKQLERLYCRDVCLDFLDILVSYTPDSLKSFLYLNASSIQNPFHCAQLLSRDRYQNLEIIVKKNPILETEGAAIGVCMPESGQYHPSRYDQLEKGLFLLIENQFPFRMVSEATLTMEWEGLDDLLVAPSGLSEGGMRKLLGFSAAGGRVVNTGTKVLNLPQEVAFTDWLNNNFHLCKIPKCK